MFIMQLKTYTPGIGADLKFWCMSWRFYVNKIASLGKSGVPGAWVPRESPWIVPLGLGTDLVVHDKTIHIAHLNITIFLQREMRILYAHQCTFLKPRIISCSVNKH